MNDLALYLNFLNKTLDQYDGFVTEAQGIVTYLQLRKSWLSKFNFAPVDFPIDDIEANLVAAQEELNMTLAEKAALEAEYNETLYKLEC